MAKRLKAYHIENARINEEGNDAGWDIYLFLDGSPTGMLVWFFYDFGGSLGNVESDPNDLELDDVFSEREIDSLWGMKFRKLIPPQGVRRRVLTADEFHSNLKPIEIVQQGIGLAA